MYAGFLYEVTGEVKRIIAEESILNEKDRVVLDKLQPIIYNEEEGIYHELGGKIADAFKTGIEFKKSLEDNHYAD